jgi:hypothetical protein
MWHISHHMWDYGHFQTVATHEMWHGHLAPAATGWKLVPLAPQD